MIMVVSVPYNAVIIAHERCLLLFYISVLEVLLKLGIVYFVICSDKLISYMQLCFVLCSWFIQNIIYGCYCSRHFDGNTLSMGMGQ